MLQKLIFIFSLLCFAGNIKAQKMAFELSTSSFLDDAVEISQSILPNLSGTGLSGGTNIGRELSAKLDFTFDNRYSFLIEGAYGRSSLRLQMVSTRAFYEAKADEDIIASFSTNSTKYFLIKVGGSMSWKLGETSKLRASLGVGSIIPKSKQEYFGKGSADHSQLPSVFYQYYQGVYMVNDPIDYYLFINPEVELIQDVSFMNWDFVVGLNSMLVHKDHLQGQVVFYGDDGNLVSTFSDKLKTIGLKIGVRYDFKTWTRIVE